MMTWAYVVVISQDKIFLCDETQTFYHTSVKYFFSHHPVSTKHRTVPTNTTALPPSMSLIG